MGFVSSCGVVWDVAKFILLCLITSFEVVIRWFFPPALKSLREHIILVTGSAHGIGREICLQISESDSIPVLVCWDINSKENEELVKDLRSRGCRAYGYEVDVANRNAVAHAAAMVRRDVGNVTIVIQNAGIVPRHQFLSHNPREITRCFEVNVFGDFWVLREFLPNMIEAGSGHIVSISSDAVFVGSKNLVPYNASMGAVSSYMESLRAEIEGYPTKPDIKFTTVYPGVFYSGVLRNAKTNLRTLANKAIEGFRQNQEQVYVPWGSWWLSAFLRCQPSKIRAAASEWLESYSEVEADESDAHLKLMPSTSKE